MRYIPMVRLTLTAALIGLAAPAPAHAQFGKLIKKAKHAMDPAKSDSAQRTAGNDGSMRRPAEMVDLTSARVGGLIDGLQAKLHFVTTVDGIGLAAMNERLETIEQHLPTVDPNQETRYDNAVSDHQTCMEKTLEEVARSHQSEREAAAMSSAFDRDKAMKIGTWMQKIQEARQRGDTAEANRVQGEMQREISAPYLAMAHQDSAEAQKRCGPAPVKPADLAALDSLRAERDTLSERIRAVQNDADSLAAERSGMTRRQFDMAKERVLSYLGGSKQGLDKVELNALDARHDEIERLAVALHTQGVSW